MQKPITFDEIIHGNRVTVTHGPTTYTKVALEAPYDVTTKTFEGGRDVAEPDWYDNELARFVLSAGENHS